MTKYTFLTIFFTLFVGNNATSFVYATNLSISNHSFIEQNDGYTLGFNINGGVPPYVVNGNIVSGNSYSQFLNCKDNYNLHITDFTNDILQISGLSPCGDGAIQDAVNISSFLPIIIDVLDNDPAVYLTITAVSQATNGSVAINPDGTITYTPNLINQTEEPVGIICYDNYIDSFVYQVTDQFGITSTTLVTISNYNLPNIPLSVNYTYAHLDPSVSSEYTVYLSVHGGYPPYTIAGYLNVTNVTNEQLSFSVPNYGGFTLIVTDSGGNQFIVDVPESDSCNEPYPANDITINYQCWSENVGLVSIPILNPIYPITVSGSGIYDPVNSNPFFTSPEDEIIISNGNTFDFLVYKDEYWEFYLTNGDGTIISENGYFKLPNPSFDVPLTMCVNDAPITLYENSIFSPSGEILNGQFFFSSTGGTDSENGFSGEFNPTQAGIGQHLIAYCVEAQNGGGAGFGNGYYQDGCSVCSEQTIVVANNCLPVSNPPTAAFNTFPAAADTLYICQGQTVYFNNTSQNATNYNWSFGDGTQSDDSNPAHTFNTPGTNEVSLVAYNVETEPELCLLAVDDYLTSEYNNAIDFNPLFNDIVCDNDVFITNFTAPENGTIVSVEGEYYIYTPYNGFIGEDCFTYTISNGTYTSTASICVSITQLCIVANDDVSTRSINLGYATPIDVFANDFICQNNNDVRILTLFSETNYNYLSCFDVYSGIVYYAISANAADLPLPLVDSFKYVITSPYGIDTGTVYVTITGVCNLDNDDQNLTMNVSDNSLVINANGLQFSCPNLDPTHSFDQPANGIVTPVDAGYWQLTYTPNPGFIGTDCFNYYWVSDLFPYFSDTMTICITVTDGGGTPNGKLNLSPPTSPQTTSIANTTVGSTNPNQNNNIPPFLPSNQRLGVGLTDTARIIVVVLPGTAPNLSCIGTVCAGDEVSYSTNAQCSTYNWTINGAETFTGQGTPNINVIWGSDASGSIELSVENCTPDLCSIPLSVPIGIVPTSANISGDSLICANQTAIYTLPYINGAEYTWSITPPTAGNITAGQYTPTVSIAWLAQNATLSANINHQLANCSAQANLSINLRPRFDVLPATTLICTNDALSISTDPTTPCTWDIGTGTILNGQGTTTILASWQDAGTQNITATATNPTQVCQITETTTITTKNTAATPANISGATQICPQQIYTYTATPNIGGTQFVWAIEGGTIISGQNSANVQVQFNNAAPYTLSVYRQYNNAPVCTSDTLSLNITPLPTNAFTIAGSNSVCAGTTSTYNATSALTNPTYNWSIEPPQAGTILQGQGTANISIVWSTNPQNATVLVGYCAQNQSIDVAINALPQVSIAQDNLLCSGSSTTLSFSPAYNTHVWTNSNGNTISNNAVATVSQADTYTLTIADTNGCTAIAEIAVDTLPKPTALIYSASSSSFNIEIPGQTSIFEAALGQYFTYQWYENGIPLAAQTSPIFTYTSTNVAGYFNYNLIVTHSQTGCTDESNTISIYQYNPSTDTSGTGVGCPECPPSPSCVIAAGSSANFTVTANNNSCDTFIFDNQSTGSPVSYTWLFGDTLAFNTTNPNPITHTYNQIGKYRVYLLANFTNLSNPLSVCSYADFDSVSIPIKANFNATQNACVGDTVSFTDYSLHIVETQLTNWTWDFGDGTTATNIQNPQHIYTNSGTYTVTQTVTNDTCTSTITHQLIVNGAPTVSFSANSVACATNALIFTPDQANLNTFQWAFGNGDSTTLSNPTYAYFNQGTYQASLTATDIYGCANTTYSQSINILPAPIPENITATDTILCAGSTATLTAPANATAYLWSNGSTQAQITVGTSGNYSVLVSLDNGCYYQTAPKQITVYNPPPAQANLYSLTGSFCQNDTIMVAANAGYSYLWNSGDTTATFIGEQNGFYIVTVTDTQTGCTAVSSPVLINLNESPEVPQISPGNLIFCEGETHLVTAIANNNATYIWSNNQTGNSILVYSSGNYTVTVSNNAGCTNTNSVQIQVSPRPNASAFPSGCYDICAGDTINIPLPTNATATWYLNGEQISAPAVSGTNLIPMQSGSYSVLLNTPLGCTDASDTLTLEVLNNCYEPPLPVELLSFDGTIKEKGNFLRWITAAELNCNYYTLYASTNANANHIETFQSIAQLNGNGTTNTAHTYTFMHPTNEPITYYQLSQTDFDGTQKTLGNLVLMRNKADVDIGISISPNPTYNNFNVALLGNNLPNNVQINVVDVTGRIVQQNIYATNQQITINRHNLPNGLYFVQVQDANSNQVLGVSKVVFE